MNSTLELLEAVENVFSSEYKAITVNGQKCFVSDSGTVFYFVLLEQFRSMIVEYADSLKDAEESLFEDGDQFNIDQNFEDLIKEIREELLEETV